MTFSDFRKHLQSERVAIYNFFHDHTWEDDYTKIYTYVLPKNNQNNPAHTREARHGAHFLVKRYCDFGVKGIHMKFEAKRSVYVTRHTEIVNEKECFVIRKDILESLSQDKKYTAYILFETDDSFAEMIEAKELKKKKFVFHTSKNQQEVEKYYYPIESFPLYKKDFTSPEENIDYFQPKFLGQHRFHMTVHGYETNVHVYNGNRLIQAGHFKTITEFFNHFNLAAKGAKLISIQRMFAKKQNFTFKGLTFIFDDSWETVEYKVRLSKEQKELIKEIEAKKAELAAKMAELEPEEEMVVVQSIVVHPEEEPLQIDADMSLNSHLKNPPVSPPFTEEEDDDSLNIWDLPY